MIKPIQVYLDSCDFSDLATSDSKPNKEDLEKTFQFLLDARDKGIIEIRYSSIAILECIHQKEEHKDYALQRAQVIEQLSGGSVLVDIMTLHLATCFTAFGIYDAANDALSKRVRRKHNLWYADISPVFASYEKIYIDKINATIQERPKKERKHLKKLMFNGGRLSDYSITRLSSLGNMFERQLSEQYPMLNGFPLQKTMTQYLKKKISRAEIVKQLGETVFSPFNYTKWFVESIKRRKPDALNSLRQQGEQIANAIKTARAELKELEKKYADMDKKELQRKLKAYKYPAEQIKAMLLRDLFSTKRKTIEEHMLKEKWDDNVLHAESLLSIDFVSELLAEHITSKIHDKRSKLAASDFGDVQHCTYIPFVDVFRCDKRTAVLTSNIAKKYNLDTFIARNLADVVSYIKNNTPETNT